MMRATSSMIRRIGSTAVIIGLLAWSAASASADYAARRQETMAELARKELDEPERKKLTEILDSYFKAREQCLEGLVKILEVTGANEQSDLFVARAGICATTGSKILGDALKPFKEPSIAALGFMNVFHAQEHAFLTGLAGLHVADSRDRIVIVRDRLKEMSGILDKKWKALDSQDDSIDARTKRIAEEIKQDLAETVNRAAEANKDVVERLAQGVRQYAESDTSPTPPTGSAIADAIISMAKPALGVLLQYWEARNLRSARRADSYQELIKSELKIIVLFVEVRDDVREFLKDNDFPTAEAAFAEARKSADTFVGNAKTSGQKTDASELRDNMLKVLAKHLKDAAQTYGKFVDQNKEKFFGPIGPEIRKELLEIGVWEQYASYIHGYGLDAKLRQWHTQATNYFEVDLSELPNDARRRLKDGLRAIIDELIREVKAAETQHKSTETTLRDSRKMLGDKLK